LHANSLESIWDDNSAFSALPRSNGSSRIASQPRVSPTISSSKFSPFENQHTGTHNQPQQRARTLQEIETEMLAKAEQGRKVEREQQLFAQLHKFEQHEQPPQRTRQQDPLAQQHFSNSSSSTNSIVSKAGIPMAGIPMAGMPMAGMPMARVMPYNAGFFNNFNL
jgi:hypothetical protein